MIFIIYRSSIYTMASSVLSSTMSESTTNIMRNKYLLADLLFTIFFIFARISMIVVHYRFTSNFQLNKLVVL